MKISADHVVRCYKGRCLIESHDRRIAVWLDRHEVSHCGDHIEFTIDHDKAYFVSALNRLLRDSEYHLHDDRYTGQNLIDVFTPISLNAVSHPLHGLH